MTVIVTLLFYPSERTETARWFMNNVKEAIWEVYISISFLCSVRLLRAYTSKSKKLKGKLLFLMKLDIFACCCGNDCLV